MLWRTGSHHHSGKNGPFWVLFSTKNPKDEPLGFFPAKVRKHCSPNPVAIPSAPARFPNRFLEDFLSHLLAPENLTFAVALALLAMLLLVQMLGLSAIIADADSGPDAAPDVAGGLTSFMGIGRVPLLVWFSCLLACFALLGLALQDFFENIFGAPLSVLPASGAALLAALPANAALTRLIGHVWPHDETTAVHLDQLVGLRACIAVGTASRGSPARAVVHDPYGQMHNVMVEPHEAGARLLEGTEILLVRYEGSLFFAVEPQGPTWLID
jgi:hypothetical protein